MKPANFFESAADKLDSINMKLGNLLSTLNMLLVAIIVIQVVLRYAFSHGSVALEELQWHLFGIMIMFGLSYCITNDSHVRLDVLYQRMSPRLKAYINLTGTIFLLTPMLIIVLYHGIDYAYSAMVLNESSSSPLGLPYRWILKSVIPISMVVALAAAFSSVLKNILIIAKVREHK